MAGAAILVLATAVAAGPETASGQVPVPSVDSGIGVIAVRVGGVRDPQTSTVSPLAGVKLELLDGSTDQIGAPIDEAWASCESDQDGDCVFEVPDTGTGGANRDRRFWIQQTDTPAGYFNDAKLVTSANGNTFEETSYAARTGTQLRAGEIYASTSGFMAGATGVYRSSGIWPESLDNPPYPDRCGLNVALVMDLSYSVEPDQAKLKTAATALTGALQGTPSQVALFTFGSRAPARGAENINRPLTPVSTAEGVALVDGWINGVSVPQVAEATNWDRGLMQVAQSSDQFDVVIVITDGNPTRYGLDGLGTGIQTRFIEMENSIFSANAVKQIKNARIVAVGVGDGATTPGDNLAAISGPETGNPNAKLNDYYQKSWDDAVATLSQVALTGCTGSLTVVKQIVPKAATSGDVTGAQPAGGWDFALSGTGATISGPTTITTAAATGGAAASFEVDPSAPTSTISVIETVQTGAFDPFPVDTGSGLKNADCVDLRTTPPTPLPVTDSAAVSTYGFSVPVSQAAAVSCTVYNQPHTNEPASVKVSKVWEIVQIDSQGNQLPGTVVTSFDDPNQPGEFSAGLKVVLDDGSQPVNHGDMSWGTAYSGMLESYILKVDEDPVPQIPIGCQVLSTGVTGQPNGAGSMSLIASTPFSSFNYTLIPGLNLFQVTNRIGCATQLSLYKTFDSSTGSAVSTDWLLTATPADSSALPGPSGRFDSTATPSDPPTAYVTPGVPYVMAESDGPAEFVQFEMTPDASEPLVIGASGSWLCMLEDQYGDIFTDPSAWVTEGMRGSVAVHWGGHIHCFAVNYSASVKVTKQIAGGTATADDWTFALEPLGEVPAGLIPRRGVKAGDVTSIRPTQAYRISEESGGPPGYALDSIECSWDAADGTHQTAEFQDAAELNLGLGAHAECVFTNRALPPPPPTTPPAPTTPPGPPSSTTPSGGGPIGPNGMPPTGATGLPLLIS
ncbi:MAG: VWA domain-containing protein, partial [Bifidobacteriaceae bacterium]|nr:VWA domain-containing protein [Bifidobacteriaceae bacterium]